MKQAEAVTILYEANNNRIYTIENGLQVWDVRIDIGLNEKITIGHLSDIHYNLCNQQDFDEADPVIMSTYEYRKWLANGASVLNARRAFAFLDDVDQIVLNGDTLDYLSHGCMELMQREVWDAHPDVIATLGGHEVARRMQGTVPESTTREFRLSILEKFWPHDIYYISKLVKNKVLIVGLFNDQARYTAEQEKRLANDIRIARENGYVILIFEHEPIRTNNSKEQNLRIEDILCKGDTSGFPVDFYTGVSANGAKLAGNDACDASTKAVYNLIVHNGDVIRGVFAGHYHNEIYTEIHGTHADGTPCIIPQYIHSATAYEKGHLMRVTVQ